MSAEKFTVLDGGCDPGDPAAGFRSEARAWIAAAEAWITVPSEPNYKRACEALSSAWWACAKGRAAGERISGREALHGVDPPEASTMTDADIDNA